MRRPRPTRAATALAAGALAACAAAPAPPVSPVRFANAPPAWRVDDRRDVPRPPAARPAVRALGGFDGLFYRPALWHLSAHPRARALGTNSLDEVPDSTWFTNRVGVRAVPLAELRRGPGDGRGPDRAAPLAVIKGKHLGVVPGFVVRDAAGVRWLVKLETPGTFGQVATDIAVQRLLWLAGFHVTENHPGWLVPGDVVLDPSATLVDDDGRRRPMTPADLAGTLTAALRDRRGRVRVLFSRFVDGVPLGPTPAQGVRADDPNDTIPHERRRELRGLEAFAAWLSHTDVKEMATLDAWGPDPDAPGRHVVRHYLVDFGNSLGLYAKNARHPDEGYTTLLDGDHHRAALTLGLWRRPWEDRPAPPLPEVGLLEPHRVDLDRFTTPTPFLPFLAADDLDALWAVRILLKITPAQLVTALRAGGFRDPRAVPHLAVTLAARRRALARQVFDRVAPLDEFVVEDGRLCFVDLAVRHRLAVAPRGYAAASFDWAAAPRDHAELAPSPGARRCAPRLRGGLTHDGYTIVRLAVRAGARALPPVEVHLARGPDGAPRVIGVERRTRGRR